MPQQMAPEGDGSLPINIYLVAHSHLDPGWINTLDEYYTAKVKYILDNVVEELWKASPASQPHVDPVPKGGRKFTWCETVFLEKWWKDPATNEMMRTRLRHALQEGRFEIVGGGWVQHDESLTNYKMQVQQMNTGFDWLYSTFPFLKGRVNTMWQIDPFGASALTPLLFGNDFKYILLNRVGDEIKDQLKNSRNMDFYWTNPFSKDRNQALLTHVTNIHYSIEQSEYWHDFL